MQQPPRRSPAHPAGRTPRRLLLALCAVLAAPVAGCGSQPATAGDGTTVLVTEGFGRQVLVQAEAPRRVADDTALAVLRGVADVRTGAGGAVASIDGVGDGDGDPTARGRDAAWFAYVNGRRAEDGASTEVRSGDRTWWDRHRTVVPGGPPAVVGQFPAPFTTGIDGRRLPVRVECTQLGGASCRQARDVFVGLGLAASRGGLQSSLARETLRVLVGPYRTLREDLAARTLEQGLRESGVFARFTRDGRALDLLDPSGRVTRTLGPGTGLVAATELEGSAPVWLVTGTDQDGVRAAVGALEEGTLTGRFAVAVAGGEPLALPDRPAR